MWIRSQDRKRLSDCIDFHLQEKLKESYAVIGASKNSCGHIMGTYSSKEKAIKILDDIQKRICLLKSMKYIINSSEIAEIKYIEQEQFVYQMPKDNEI